VPNVSAKKKPEGRAARRLRVQYPGQQHWFGGRFCPANRFAGPDQLREVEGLRRNRDRGFHRYGLHFPAKTT
jgi:hypothetical protein